MKDEGTWNFHWAGVVATSASDSVTLENYNRSASERGVDDDLRWYFQMYGKERPAQTFHQRTRATAKLDEPFTAAYLKSEGTQQQQGCGAYSASSTNRRARRRRSGRSNPTTRC